MNLLIITQKVDKDDPILGFFHRWIEEFAKNCQSVSVICLEEGRHEFPSNVKVYSLGKVKGSRSSFGDRLKYTLKFFGHVWSLRRNYDSVFVHMNPIYLAEAGFIWKLLGKKTALWYTHRNVDAKLRIAERFADIIFTAAKESFTLKSQKVMVVGHGIDVSMYSNAERAKPVGSEPISIASVGRITPIKDPVTLIETARILKSKWDKRFTITFIGSPIVGNDSGYSDKVKGLVKQYELESAVFFAGDVNPSDMPARYSLTDISINLTPTGGLDKVVLESMAGGVPVITSNTAFKEYLTPFEGQLIFERGNAEELASKIIALFDSGQAILIGKQLQKTAQTRADLSVLIRTIVAKLS